MRRALYNLSFGRSISFQFACTNDYGGELLAVGRGSPHTIPKGRQDGHVT